MEKILLAESCIEVYENIEEFLEKSGWRRDNPELCSECYLFENHICRKIQGKIWYFSRIQYENGLRGEAGLQLENTQYLKCERAVIS